MMQVGTGRHRFGIGWMALAWLATILIVVVAGVAFVVGPAMGRWRMLPILSGSMRPSLGVGALAVATPEPPTAIRVGQVIVFRIPVGDQHAIAHRVIQVVAAGNDPIVRTKGDANRSVDPWQAHLHGSVVWVVRGSVPLLGYVALALDRLRWLIAGLLAAVLILPAAAMWVRPELGAWRTAMRRGP